MTRPDLVVVITDQQRYDQVGYASAGHFETPTLDRLAASGVIFDAAYSTAPVCVPARVSILTGLQPHRVPAQDNSIALREGFWTVAHELRQAGYQTAAIGKMHFSPIHADHGFETLRLCEHLGSRWFESPSERQRDGLDDYSGWLEANGYRDRRFDADYESRAPFELPIDAHPTAWVEREVISFLSARDRTRPMFLVISFPHPHAPYDPPEPYASMYDPADSLLPVVGQDANAGLPAVFALATAQSPTREEAENARAVRSFLALVRGLVRQIDDSVGRIVPHLDLASTLLLFTSDHGDFSGHRGLMRKNPWIPFDDLSRVPFFATGAGMVGGRRLPTLVQSSDIALTCLDYAGVAPPGEIDFDSRSLRPQFEAKSGADDHDRVVYCGFSMDWPMVRRGRYKLIGHTLRPGRVVFDLEDDPDERFNLFLDPQYADVRADLTELLAAMRERPVVHRGSQRSKIQG